MKWRKLIASGVLGAMLTFSGVAAQAAGGSEPDPTHDARLEGYEGPVIIDGSTGLIWMLFIFLSIISMSALFKDSKRARTE
jgi:predicted dehydrogenase